MRKFTYMVLAMLMVLMMVSCTAKTQQPSATPAPTPAPTPTEPAIALVMSGKDTFNEELAAKAAEYAAKSGYRILPYFSQGSQVNDIYAAIGEGAKSIILMPQDPDNLQVVLEEADAQNIPIINVMQPVNAVVKMLIAPDYQKMGLIAAKNIAAARPNGAEVLTVESGGTAFIPQLIHDGFAGGAAQIDNVSVMQSIIVDSMEAAYEQVKALSGGTNAIYSETDFGALGAVKAIAESGADISVVSTGGSAQIMQAIKSGAIQSSVFVSPTQLADLAVYYAIAAAMSPDGQMPQYAGLEIEVIDSANVDQYLAYGNYAHTMTSTAAGATPAPTDTPAPTTAEQPSDENNDTQHSDDAQ
ncbi:MAG: substrate-binding domain-containing protein [Christensenellaceae bacterium]